MPRNLNNTLETTTDSVNEILSGRSQKGFLARLMPFVGPAFIASVAYIDPGNFATNIQAGATFGYTLVLAENHFRAVQGIIWRARGR